MDIHVELFSIFGQVFALVSPWLTIPVFVGLGLWVVLRGIRLLAEEDDRLGVFDKWKPVEAAKPETTVSQVDYSQSKPYTAHIDNDHCAYCGGMLKRKWHKCPNCGAPRR